MFIGRMGVWISDYQKKNVKVRVFAFEKDDVKFVIKERGKRTEVPMIEEKPHLYTTTIGVEDLNLLYKFKLNDEQELPDPYSNFQPNGVHGFSQLIDHQAYHWQDGRWQGHKQEELIIMEVHIGTFTEEGTFRAAVDKLDYLLELGVNTIEIMPITQTPGRWNWGYDGTGLFSVNSNYGTPDDLKYLIDCCHQKGIGVILDVVYNHFGPEGNYLPEYGPYFTDKHETPWGPAVNFDDHYSEYTRQMVLDNIRYWLEVYHFDGLRLDAVHAIKDESPVHILAKISETVKIIADELDREIVIIAESESNDVQLIKPLDEGGYGIDAQWMDDFHHCIHVTMTGEAEGYYMDYGEIKDFEKAYKNYLYTGQYSEYLDEERGTDASQHPGNQFVVALQNHDQVGNRAKGDRIATLIEFPYLKAAAGLVLFSAYIPMVFMGEEYGEKKPFLFFTDYQDSELQKAVSEGRRKEFENFSWDEVPDPQDSETFYNSKLTPKDQWDKENQSIFNFYKDLINLRVSHPVLKRLDKDRLEVEVDEEKRTIKVSRWYENAKLMAYFNLGESGVAISHPAGRQIFNSNWTRYGGREEGRSEELKEGQMLIIETELNN